MYQAVSWSHICVLLSCRRSWRRKLKVREETMKPLVNRKRFQCHGCCRLPGPHPPGERTLRCLRTPGITAWLCSAEPTAASRLINPNTCYTLWERHQKALPAQLLQEGVSGIMFCSTQEVKKSISSDFFFKLHIISPLPWTFVIEIEARLDLVF